MVEEEDEEEKELEAVENDRRASSGYRDAEAALFVVVEAAKLIVWDRSRVVAEHMISKNAAWKGERWMDDDACEWPAAAKAEGQHKKSRFTKSPPGRRCQDDDDDEKDVEVEEFMMMLDITPCCDSRLVL